MLSRRRPQPRPPPSRSHARTRRGHADESIAQPREVASSRGADALAPSRFGGTHVRGGSLRGLGGGERGGQRAWTGRGQHDGVPSPLRSPSVRAIATTRECAMARFPAFRTSDPFAAARASAVSAALEWIGGSEPTPRHAHAMLTEAVLFSLVARSTTEAGKDVRTCSYFCLGAGDERGSCRSRTVAACVRP